MSTNQPTRTDDLVEIQQLLARYAVTITQEDIDGLIGVFTPDGTYSAFGDTYRLDRFPELVAAAPKGLFLTGTALVDIDGDSASGKPAGALGFAMDFCKIVSVLPTRPLEHPWCGRSSGG